MKSRLVNTIALGLGVGVPAFEIFQNVQAHTSPQDMGAIAIQRTTGYDPRSGTWNIADAHWAFAIVGAVAFKKLMSKLKVGKLII